MVEEIMFFLPPLLALALLALGFQIRDATTVILGGLLLFIYGIAILIVPLPVITSLTNDLVGAVCFGFGAYIWIKASMEQFGPNLNRLWTGQ